MGHGSAVGNPGSTSELMLFNALLVFWVSWEFDVRKETLMN